MTTITHPPTRREKRALAEQLDRQRKAARDVCKAAETKLAGEQGRSKGLDDQVYEAVSGGSDGSGGPVGRAGCSWLQHGRRCCVWDQRGAGMHVLGFACGAAHTGSACQVRGAPAKCAAPAKYAAPGATLPWKQDPGCQGITREH